MWNGEPVVTFKDIDFVHERAEGTASRNFRKNREHFIEGVDYFIVSKNDVPTKFVGTRGFDSEDAQILNDENRRLGIEVPNRGITLMTESGYLMIVKSFTDDKSWEVQRKLVNAYFKLKEILPESNEIKLLSENWLELNDRIDTLINHMTINYQQQQELLSQARTRVNKLLGGAKSREYKEWGRTYFKNLWLNFCENFDCGTYKDLNPERIMEAKQFIKEWNYRR